MITIVEHGPIRELRLNRPPVNALSPELLVALRQSIELAPGDSVRAVVLSGSPGRFSGGLDIPLLLTLDREGMAALWRDMYALLGAIACSPIPLVAAITGHAPAGGTVLSLFCDCRVMAEGDWKLGLNEVQVGLTLPRVIFRALEILVGHRQAERLAVTGMLVSPAEALRIGLVDEIVPADGVVARAVDCCRILLALPPQALAETRSQARAELVGLFKESLNNELEDIMRMWWRPETQATLHAVVQQMGKAKQKQATGS